MDYTDQQFLRDVSPNVKANVDVWRPCLDLYAVVPDERLKERYIEDNQLVSFNRKISHEDALLGVGKTSEQHEFFFMPYDASVRDIFHIKNNQMKKKVVPKLRPEVKVKVDIVTIDDIKIYYTGKFQDFTARYIIHIYFFYLQQGTTTL